MRQSKIFFLIQITLNNKHSWATAQDQALATEKLSFFQVTFFASLSHSSRVLKHLTSFAPISVFLIIQLLLPCDTNVLSQYSKNPGQIYY